MVRWGFDVILIVGVALSALIMYGRWRDRQRAASEYKCWSNLDAIQRETYLSLAPDTRVVFNFGDCLDSQVFLTDLARLPTSQRGLALAEALTLNHGHIPSASGR